MVPSGWRGVATTQADTTTRAGADYRAMDDTAEADTFTALIAAHLETGGSDVDMTNVDATCAANPAVLVLDAMAASG